jgi:predicted nucleic acid-binding protein
LVWSYILEYENEQNPFELRKKAILKWKDLASEYIIENKQILAFGESLSEKGLKPKDALHVSCAKYAKCDYFFTTDNGILKKKIDGLVIMNPVNFIELKEEYH